VFGCDEPEVVSRLVYLWSRYYLAPQKSPSTLEHKAATSPPRKSPSVSCPTSGRTNANSRELVDIVLRGP
jgi:hypothetical protein